MDETDLFSAPHRMPTPSRPLTGRTVLVVEDSLYASDAVRLLCLRSGARIRRADCLTSARRHLQVYRPWAILVDLGLPDGSGLELIAELDAARPRIPAIVAISGDDTAEGAALAAGADRFLVKPVHSLARFQEALLSCQGEGPEMSAPPYPAPPHPAREEAIAPDPVAYRDDMAHAAALLDGDAAEETLDYVARFLGGVARSAGDSALEQAALRLVEARATGAPMAPLAARVAGLVHARVGMQDAALKG